MTFNGMTSFTLFTLIGDTLYFFTEEGSLATPVDC